MYVTYCKLFELLICLHFPMAATRINREGMFFDGLAALSTAISVFWYGHAVQKPSTPPVFYCFVVCKFPGLLYLPFLQMHTASDQKVEASAAPQTSLLTAASYSHSTSTALHPIMFYELASFPGLNSRKLTIHHCRPHPFQCWLGLSPGLVRGKNIPSFAGSRLTFLKLGWKPNPCFSVWPWVLTISWSSMHAMVNP